jgi:hypothetical protein
VRHDNRAALGALVVAFALLFFAEGAALPTAWLPVEEAAVLVHARGGGGTHSSSGILYPAVLAPAARSLSPPAAHRFAKALSAVLWALAAIPCFLLARRLVSPRASLAVAALAVAAPSAVYGTAAVPDALALLLAISSLPLLARASERGSARDLLGSLALATAAALTRPWFVVLPVALLIAYELPRDSRDSFLRWPRALAFAGFAAFAYIVLAATAPEVGDVLTSPGAIARAATASLVVAVVGVGVVPWLLVSAGVRPLAARAETALLATCLPALALSAGVFGAAEPGAGVEERPLLVLVPLVLSLAAAAWLGRVGRLSAAAPAAVAVVLGAFALPSLGRVPAAHATGLAVVVANGGSKAFVIAGVTAVVVVAFVATALLREHRFALPAALAALLLVGQAAAWSSVHREARALAASEPTPRDWVDRNAGSGSRVFVVGTAAAPVDPRFVAQLTLWNRSVRGSRQLDLSKVDVQTGLVPDSGNDLALLHGTGVVGSKEIARSAVGVLVRPPLGVAETIEGLFPDGWSGDHATYRRFTGPPKPGTVRVVISRLNWGGQDRPADVRIDSEPLNGASTQAAHIVIHAGKEYKLDIPVPPPPFQIAMTIQPTFAPAEFGATDTRQLGAQISFTYHPGK